MSDDFEDFEASPSVPMKRGPRKAPFAQQLAERGPGKAPKEARMPQIGQLRTLQNDKIDGQKYRVRIFGSENAKDQHVDLAVNGHNVRIKRGEWVQLDECFVEVLRNAVIETYEQNPDTGVKSPVTRLVYPYEAVPVPAAA